MDLLKKTLIPVLLTPMALLADVSDTTNERIPVTRAEMEDHWQLDCSASWGSLAKVASNSLELGSCQVSADLMRKIQLCEFIHQPPGSSRPSDGPDYKKAGQILGSGDCEVLRKFIGN